jgi:glycosyltransferase involved in cell wall biosynthesis
VSGSFSIICLSSQDWDADLPTNRQQIMRRAAAEGHEVVFVETGRFLGKHLLNMARRPRRAALRRLTTGDPVAPKITVRKALNVAPWGQRYAKAAAVNGRLNGPLVRRLARSLRRPVVLWIYDPCAARIAGRGAEAFAVYDCVDDYAEQVGPDPRRRSVVAAADAEAAQRARLVFATTRPLFERHRNRNARTYLARNAGDFSGFAPAVDPAFAAPEVAGLARPVLGFVGNIDRRKVDVDLLASLADERPEWTLVLIGPATRDLRASVADLAKRPNVVYLGRKRYDEVPRFVAGFDVGLVPYAVNEYTRSCFPLKVFEYLAAGKPVVASGVPEVSGMEPDVVLAEGAGAFAAAVAAALERTTPEDQARRQRLAADNTWEGRAGRLLELVAEELAA